ncbi:LD-carboxypeptidase [Kitasatospora herbaricolor]|uniref:S66 family peptidase n=1 Tax=Kitasatospora herbaricolor TaxID=68217 RepID=UPI00174CFDD3|nr:S66 peptidase family protein [Kitasatospora herbaricolor]MDQ0311738.1 muramoyltetrapeptide carboxypeptidase LdcA involved in peptidoglycan recycling [Kitasatospora herbaricolor]GGU96224.1 LD-carboxypeptidase [Kitasatospora herbaricolor]
MTTTPPSYPAKPRPGDRVAVISPAAGLPGILPLPYELGLRRLREEFGLVPVEYPSTRRMGATARERAADIHAAFADPDVKAVIASIGGDDQITVIPHLDAELIRANPKPFFGYSDNTNLLAHLWNLGIVGYHGGTVMVEFGRPGALAGPTADSLRAALFTSGPYELRPAAAFTDRGGRWEDPRTFDAEPELTPGEGWFWHRPDQVVEGVSWGGNLEILGWLLMADRGILAPEAYAGCVLFLETSEEQPAAVEVYRVLRNMGERGLLRQFPALLMGRAKAWSHERPLDPAAGAAYRDAQRAAVLRALAEYAPDTMAVFDVDLGHTDPQLVIPYGGLVRVDGPARRITVTY